MDLESGGSAFSRCRADRRSLSRASASVGLASFPAPQPSSESAGLDEGPPKAVADKGKIEKLVLSLRSIESGHADILEKIRIEADYFERNAERMRYPSSVVSICSSVLV